MLWYIHFFKGASFLLFYKHNSVCILFLLGLQSRLPVVTARRYHHSFSEDMLPFWGIRFLFTFLMLGSIFDVNWNLSCLWDKINISCRKVKNNKEVRFSETFDRFRDNKQWKIKFIGKAFDPIVIVASLK